MCLPYISPQKAVEVAVNDDTYLSSSWWARQEVKLTRCSQYLIYVFRLYTNGSNIADTDRSITNLKPPATLSTTDYVRSLRINALRCGPNFKNFVSKIFYRKTKPFNWTKWSELLDWKQPGVNTATHTTCSGTQWSSSLKRHTRFRIIVNVGVDQGTCCNLQNFNFLCPPRVVQAWLNT